MPKDIKKSTKNNKIVKNNYFTKTGKQFYPVRPTSKVLQDTTNFFPITGGDFGNPVYGTYNRNLYDQIDPRHQIKEVLYPSGMLGFSDSILENFAKNRPSEEFLSSQPRPNFINYANGGYIPSYGYGSWMNSPQYTSNNTSYTNYMDKPFNSGADLETTQQVSNAANVIPVWGQVNSIAQSIAGPIEQKAKAINPETGLFENKKKAVTADVARTFMDPFTNLTRSLGDDNASTGEKIGAGINMLLPGVGSLWSGSKMDRIEEENKKAIEEAKLKEKEELRKRNAPIIAQRRLAEYNSQGNPSYNNVFANGGFIPSYANGGMLPYGGKLDTSDIPNVTSIDNGGTHQQNPLGGVKIGNKGLLEEGEVKVKIKGNDYVFSNRF